MRKAMRIGYFLAIFAIFTMVWLDVALAADKMPSPAPVPVVMKPIVGPIHGAVRTINIAWKSFWGGLRKYGPLAPVVAAGLVVVDGVENVPRTVANTVTVWNSVNYNYDVGAMSPTAKKVQDSIPALLPF